MVNVQNNSVYGFTNLKNHFQSGINMTQYDKAISTANNTTVGNIPDDLLKIVLAANPTNKGEAIKNIQESFKDVNKVLGGFEELQKEALARFEATPSNAAKILQESSNTFFLDETYNKKMEELISSAGETLLKGMSQHVPNIGKVNITPLGYGSFAQTFKCEFLDNDGKKIISDKVIKTFRPNADLSVFLINKIAETLDKVPIDAIVENGVDKNTVEMAKTQFSMMSNMLKTSGDDIIQKSAYMHGPAAETNIAEYIRHFAGHKTQVRNGVVIPYMSHLGKNSFMVSEFVGSDNGAKSTFPFKRLGLRHTDLDFNPANTINGVCVDLGGIMAEVSYKKLQETRTQTNNQNEAYRLATKSVTTGDKFLMRKLKKFMDTPTPEGKNKYLESLQKEADSTRNMIDKRKINAFIAEMKDKYADDLVIMDETVTTGEEVAMNDLSPEIKKEFES